MTTKPIAIKIVATLQKAGHIAYFAGGWVRDYLLDVPSTDIDIATSASVEEIQALFPKTIPIGIAFGIIIVVEKNHSFEVATFRAEKDHLDGRRPVHIEPTTPENDALRRDFTINGIFFDPIQDTLLDYVGGQEDIKRDHQSHRRSPQALFRRQVAYGTRSEIFNALSVSHRHRHRTGYLVSCKEPLSFCCHRTGLARATKDVSIQAFCPRTYHPP